MDNCGTLEVFAGSECNTEILAVAAALAKELLSRTVCDEAPAAVYAIMRAVAAPARTVVLAGIEIAVPLLVFESVIEMEGAAFNRTLQMRSAPAMTGFGEHVSESGFSCSTVIAAEALDEPSVAVTVTDVAVAVVGAVAVNVAEVAPEATVTAAGTVVAATTLLARATLVPPSGAGADIVTVHAVFVPPIRVDVAQTSLLTVSAEVSEICVVFVTMPRLAVTVAVPDAEAEGVAVNCAADAPALTRTVVGT